MHETGKRIKVTPKLKLMKSEVSDCCPTPNTVIPWFQFSEHCMIYCDNYQKLMTFGKIRWENEIFNTLEEGVN